MPSWVHCHVVFPRRSAGSAARSGHLLLPCLGFIAVLASSHAAHSQERGEPIVLASDGIRLVCVDGAGLVAPVASQAPGTAQELWEGSVSRADGGQQITHCWAWSQTCPPARYEPDERVPPRCDSSESEPLNVRTSTPETLSNEEAPPVEIAAAPAEMWREVPRSLLPTWTSTAGRSLAIRRTSEPWRLQACTASHCSLWTDSEERHPLRAGCSATS